MWKSKYTRQQRYYYKNHKKRKGFCFLDKPLLLKIRAILHKTISERLTTGLTKKEKKQFWERHNYKLSWERKNKWAKNNPHLFKDCLKKYQQSTRGIMWRRKYAMKKYYSSPHFRVRICISSIIRIRLKKRLSGKKGRSLNSFLPYSIDDLIKHLENRFDDKMSWNNYGTYWHIDHIKPDSLFCYNSVEDKDFQDCWSLKNLQPLEKITNIKKGKKF